SLHDALPISLPLARTPTADSAASTRTRNVNTEATGLPPVMSERMAKPPLRRFENLFHLGGELLEIIGLRQEMDIVAEAVAERLFGVARNEDHLHVGMLFANLGRHFRPVHPRHHHVGDDEVDLLGAALDDLESRLAAFRLDHAITLVA